MVVRHAHHASGSVWGSVSQRLDWHTRSGRLSPSRLPGAVLPIELGVTALGREGDQDLL